MGHHMAKVSELDETVALAIASAVKEYATDPDRGVELFKAVASNPAFAKSYIRQVDNSLRPALTLAGVRHDQRNF